MRRHPATNRPATVWGVTGLLFVGVVGACGSDLPVEHPSGAEESILRIGGAGGLVTPENEFMTMPDVVITGDGRVIVSGWIEADRLGVEPLRERSISEAGVQHLLRLADNRGFLEQREVSGFDDDGGGTFVNIWADGEQFTNGAYGSYGEPDENRDSVSGFVGDVFDYLNSGSAEIGPEVDLQPTFVNIYAAILPPQDLAYYEESDFLAWELGDEMPLFDVGWCSQLDSDDVGSSFDEIQLPGLFSDDGLTFIVAARPALPGEAC